MFEIYGYGNVDALLGIFNAIAALRGPGDFLTAIAAVVVMGFFAAMLAYALEPHKLTGWKWLASVLGVYYLLWVPTATVQVLDKQGFQPPVVVANVPFGAAALGGITSSVGSMVTDLFETVFSTIPGPAAMPNELSYTQVGMMFGARAVAETSRSAFLDMTFKTNMSNFLLNCTFYDLQEGGIDPKLWNASEDLWTMMAATNPARFTPMIGGGPGTNLRSCTDAYGVLAIAMDGAINEVKERLATTLNPTAPAAVRNALIDPQIQQAYLKNGLAGAAMSVTDIIRQNGLVNSIVDAGMLGCQRSNDPACILQSQARTNATASTNAAWISGAKVAEQALPLIRNAAEAMLYAMFPIIILMLFLSSGMKTFKMVGMYVALFVSIQLWPPLFAILNYLGTQAAASQLAAAGTIVGGTFGVALQNSDAIYSGAVSMPAVVAYLVMAIPVLAYSIANGLVGVSGALFGAASAIGTAVAGPSGQAALGNMSMGNVAMDQTNVSSNMTNAFTRRSERLDGTVDTFTGTGGHAIRTLQNDTPLNWAISARSESGTGERASSAVQAAKGRMVEAQQQLSSVLQEGLSQMQRSGKNWNFAAGSGSRETADNAHARAVASQVLYGSEGSDTLANTTGVTREANANVNLGIGGGVRGGRTWGSDESARDTISMGGGGGQGGPGGTMSRGSSVTETQSRGSSGGVSGYGNAGGGVGANVRGTAGADYRHASGTTDRSQTAYGGTTEDRFADAVSRDEAFRRAVFGSAEKADEYAARLQSAKSRAERETASYNEVLSTESSASRSDSERGDVAYAPLKDGRDARNAEQLEAMMDSYDRDATPWQNAQTMRNALSLQSQRPTPPSGVRWDGLRDVHDADAAAPALSAGAVRSDYRGNRARTAARGGMPAEPTEAQMDAVRAAPRPHDASLAAGKQKAVEGAKSVEEVARSDRAQAERNVGKVQVGSGAYTTSKNLDDQTRDIAGKKTRDAGQGVVDKVKGWFSK